MQHLLYESVLYESGQRVSTAAGLSPAPASTSLFPAAHRRWRRFPCTTDLQVPAKQSPLETRAEVLRWLAATDSHRYSGAATFRDSTWRCPIQPYPHPARI